jgi:hypothetical protein
MTKKRQALESRIVHHFSPTEFPIDKLIPHNLMGLHMTQRKPSFMGPSSLTAEYLPTKREKLNAYSLLANASTDIISLRRSTAFTNASTMGEQASRRIATKAVVLTTCGLTN